MLQQKLWAELQRSVPAERLVVDQVFNCSPVCSVSPPWGCADSWYRPTTSRDRTRALWFIKQSRKGNLYTHVQPQSLSCFKTNKSTIVASFCSLSKTRAIVFNRLTAVSSFCCNYQDNNAHCQNQNQNKYLERDTQKISNGQRHVMISTIDLKFTQSLSIIKKQQNFPFFTCLFLHHLLDKPYI